MENKRFKVVTDHFKYLQKKAMQILREKHDGMCDSNTLVNEVKDFIEKEYLDYYVRDYRMKMTTDEQVAFFEMYEKTPLRWHPLRYEAIKFARKCAKEAVHEMTKKDALCLYNLVVTKAAYDKMVKFVHRMEEDGESLTLPCNWTTDFKKS